MITLIAAMDENRLIGRGNALPWHIPEDFRHFKEITMGHPIIMGRKTYESLPRRPLPGRQNIVVSRSASIDGVSTFSTLHGAILKGLDHHSQVFVIGGQSIYEQSINFCHRLVITHVDGSFDGDYWFPEIDMQRWNGTVLKTGNGFKIMEYLIKSGVDTPA